MSAAMQHADTLWADYSAHVQCCAVCAGDIECPQGTRLAEAWYRADLVVGQQELAQELAELDETGDCVQADPPVWSHQL